MENNTKKKTSFEEKLRKVREKEIVLKERERL